jgi:hypothetical protein
MSTIAIAAVASAMPHWFGLHAPNGTHGPAWGARALYAAGPITIKITRRGREKIVTRFNVAIDLLHDRQQMHGGNIDERAALSAWIDTAGLVLLRERLSERSIMPSSTEVVAVENQGFVIMGAPRRSHGYLYLVAYQVPPSAGDRGVSGR